MTSAAIKILNARRPPAADEVLIARRTVRVSGGREFLPGEEIPPEAISLARRRYLFDQGRVERRSGAGDAPPVPPLPADAAPRAAAPAAPAPAKPRATGTPRRS